MRHYLIFLLLFFPALLNAQYSSKSTISIEAPYSTGSELPFWFTHNQSGKYPLDSKAHLMTSISSHHRVDNLFNSSFGLKGGLDVVGSISNKYNFQFNQLYAGAELWNFILQAGLFSDNTYFGGLSSTNGSMDRSLNARPYPKIRFGTDEFIPFFFWKSWFSYKAEYDEGLLGNNQTIKNSHMHHKSLFTRFKFKSETYFTFGLNHFVQWGGTSDKFGDLPSSFKDYLKYITGSAGGSNFLPTDQLNVAGNQLGTYYMELALKRKKYNLSFYYSHPFEDHSGMEMDNWRDNLLGVFVDFKQTAIIEKVIYEFMYTIHQSGAIHQFGVMRGRDNYFNHGIYNTGFTYEGYAMCSPLFSPLVYNSDKIVIGINNTRLAMHHIAFNGTLIDNLKWRGLFTFTNNLGTYDKIYETPLNQFSSLLSFEYANPNFPADISLSLAGDIGEMYEDRFGVMLKISKSF